MSEGGPFRLDGQVALVTGANAGIGQAIAVAMACAGAEVLCAGRRDCDQTLEQIDAMGGEGRAVLMDLADPMAAGPLLAAERVDILVNNAGILRREDAAQVSEADWDAVIDLDLKALFFTAQAFGRQALARGSGKVVNIASVLSFQGGIRVPAYAAAKHGVAGLTRALANEWAARGVNVNAIAPGYIETANTAALREDPDRSAAILARIPAGRWGQPQDVADVAVFLASPAARYVHGAVLAVDGGWLAR